MFNPPTNTDRRAFTSAAAPLPRSKRLQRALKVGIAVGVTVIGLPFGTRAEAAADPLLDACPIDGSSTFEDSWGWARSGGRRHEGVDMIAERGTPVVAVRDGEAHFKTSGLGGRAIWLTTDDGDRFYYAHLSDWEGESRTVRAGEVIGYVGSTGNARGAHLHFETAPGGDTENPFAHTLRACVPPPEPIINEIARGNSSVAIEQRSQGRPDRTGSTPRRTPSANAASPAASIELPGRSGGAASR